MEKKGHEVEIIAPVINEDCFPELLKGKNCYEIGGWILPIMPVRPAIVMMMISSSIFTPINKISENDVLLAHGQPSNWIVSSVKTNGDTIFFVLTPGKQVPKASEKRY